MTKSQNKTNILIWLILGFIVGAALSAAVIQVSAPEETAPAQNVLFTYQGQGFGVEQLPPVLASELHELDVNSYNQKMRILEQAALGMHIAREAEQRDVAPPEIANELIQVTPPSDEDVANFYRANADQIGVPLAQVQDQIRNFLMQQRQMEKQQALVAQLMAENKLQFHLKRPVSASVNIDTAGRPSKGNPAAPVTVIEFADYQCPHCRDAARTLDRVVEENPEQVQLIFMDFPINSSGISRVIAEGGYCALQQNQFWDYQQLAFRQQRNLSKESPLQFAQELGLDQATFENCLASPEARQYVRNSEQQAIALGLRGTPTIYINGQRFQGSDLEQSLERAVLAAAQ